MSARSIATAALAAALLVGTAAPGRADAADAARTPARPKYPSLVQSQLPRAKVRKQKSGSSLRDAPDPATGVQRWRVRSGPPVDGSAWRNRPAGDDCPRGPRIYAYYPSYGWYGVYVHTPHLTIGYGYDSFYYGRYSRAYASGYGLYYGARSYGPRSNRYTGDRAYREYIVLDTPTAGAGAGVIDVAPPQRAREEALREAPPPFGSKLAPMLGGASKVPAAFALGEAKLADGDAEGAAAAFRYAVTENPESPAPRLALALARAAMGDYAGAAETLRAGLEKIDDLSVVALDVEKVFGSTEAFEAVLARAGEPAGGKPHVDVQFVRGFLQFAAGRFDEANVLLWSAYGAAGKDRLIGRLLLASERRSRTRPAGEEQRTDEQKRDNE